MRVISQPSIFRAVSDPARPKVFTAGNRAAQILTGCNRNGEEVIGRHAECYVRMCGT